MTPRLWLRPLAALVVTCAACTPAPVTTTTTPALAAGPMDGLRLDPMLFVSVAEVRRILDAIGDSIYPGLSTERVPVLLYRPGVQDVLIGFPGTPSGFRAVRAPLLGGETVLVRDDSTFIKIDDQNTTREIDSVPTLVIADQYSRLRSNLRGSLLERPRDVGARWLDGWNFVPSAYDELQVILHEMFHVVQHRRAPGKAANESAVARYPVLDSVNNALVAVEGLALRDALLASSPERKREKAAQVVAVRAERRARLDTIAAAWEDLNEFNEGTARYVEYRFLKSARGIVPSAAMFLRPGFTGYGKRLDTLFAHRLDDMVAVAAGSDDRFGNPFGGGPARYRAYELGAAQALLLDDIAPAWKQRIFNPGVFLSALLGEAVALAPDDRARALAAAREAYHYDSILGAKGAFERRGRLVIQARADSIRAAGRATLTIAYDRAGRVALAYTPFGVTAIAPQVAIYEMVPIMARFENGAELVMKDLTPLIVDRNEKTITFPSPTSADSIAVRPDGSIETDQFRLTSPVPLKAVRGGRTLRIEFR